MQSLSQKQRAAAISVARKDRAGDDLKVYGDEDNAVSEAEGGVWVQVWIWVSDKQIKEEARELSRK